MIGVGLWKRVRCCRLGKIGRIKMNARVALQLIAVSAAIAAAVADDTSGWMTVPSSGTPRICFANVSHHAFVCETDREILVDCGSLDDGRHAFELFVVAAGFPGMHELDEINVVLQRYWGSSSMLLMSSRCGHCCVSARQSCSPLLRHTPHPGHLARLHTEHS
jgi:hypothetical protein